MKSRDHGSETIVHSGGDGVRSDFPVHLSLVLALFALTASAFFYIENRFIHYDEYESLHAAWRIINGDRIYVDFDQQHNPLFYYLVTPLILLFGPTMNTVIAASYFALLPAVLCLFVIFKTAALIFDKRAGYSAAAIAASMPWFIKAGYVVRPDMMMLFCSLSALYFLYHFFATRRTRSLILSGIFISLAFCFLQKAVFVAFFMGLLLLGRIFRKQADLKHLVIIAVTGICVQAIFLLAVHLESDIGEYIFFCFTMVAHRQEVLTDQTTTNMLWTTMTDWQYTIPLVVVLAISLVRSDWRDRTTREIALGFLLLASTLLLVARPFDQYYLPAMSLLSILGGAALGSLRNQRLAAALLGIVVVLGCTNYIFWGHAQAADREHRMNKAAHVLDTTPEDAVVYDNGNLFNLFRQPLDFFWQGGDIALPRYKTYQELRPYHYDVYEQIENQRPAVISHYEIDTTARPWILWRYRQSEVYEDIYELVPNRTGYDYWTIFHDDLGSGSAVSPSRFPFNRQGDLEVRMALGHALVDAQNGRTHLPYAGVDMRFTFDREPVDLIATRGGSLMYQLEGRAELLISQANIPPGEEYRIDLPEVSEFRRHDFLWSDFRQPAGLTNPRALDASQFDGLKFIATVEGGAASLRVRTIKFQ